MITRPELIQGLFYRRGETLLIDLKVAATFESGSIDFLKPIANLPMLLPRRYKLLFKFFDQNRQEILFSNNLKMTDHYGHLVEEIGSAKSVTTLKIFETESSPGIKYFIGCYEVKTVNEMSKLIVSDFDKTLIETHYKTASEIWRALTNRLTIFKRVDSIYEKILEESKDANTLLVTLSASPHFYAKPIRVWLQQNGLDSSSIILKEMREIFFPFKNSLTFKDAKVQGFYKLNALLDLILLMNIPNKISLYGDDGESDPKIYALFQQIIEGVDAFKVMDSLLHSSSFKLTVKQKEIMRRKIELTQNNLKPCEISIVIRKL